MGAPTTAVKGQRRSYDTSGRQARAAEQREHTLDAARERFLARGYAATTVDEIAAAAGVSVATIYKSHRGKRGLVAALCERALGGEGPVPAEARSDALDPTAGAPALIAAWGALVAEVSPRVSPLLLVLREAAASDSEAAELYEELDSSRLERMTRNADRLLAAPGVRVGVTRREIRDVLWTATSPELYDLLCRRRGWSAARLGRFATDLMAGALL